MLPAHARRCVDLEANGRPVLNQRQHSVVIRKEAELAGDTNGDRELGRRGNFGPAANQLDLAGFIEPFLDRI